MQSLETVVFFTYLYSTSLI